MAGWALALPLGRRHRWTRRFLGAVGGRLGLEVQIEGKRLPGPVLFVANHVSWLDILALGGATGPEGAAFVSKDDVAAWPLIGTLARIGGTIFIARARRAQIGEQRDALAAALATGRPALLFPEGTTSAALMPFRPALFASVAGGTIPVQPIAVDYGPAAPLVAWEEEESFGANAGRVLERAGSLALTLRFLDPIDPARLDRKALAAQVQAAIAASLATPDRL